MSAGRREDRARRVGIAISILAHLAIIALYPLFSIDPTGSTLPQVDALPDPVLEGLELVELPPEPEPEPPTEEPESEPAPEPEVAVATEPEPAGPADDDEEEDEPVEEDPADATVAERMRPRLTEPRLWAPVDPESVALTDAERAQMLLDGMIRTWNDSVAVAAALAEESADWTYTDADGGRWGLADGRLYLGDFSVPIPLSLQAPAFQRDRIREWQLMLADIQRGAVTTQIRDTWADRARAIRERLEAEREERRQDGDDGAADAR